MLIKLNINSFFLVFFLTSPVCCVNKVYFCSIAIHGRYVRQFFQAFLGALVFLLPSHVFSSWIEYAHCALLI